MSQRRWLVPVILGSLVAAPLAAQAPSTPSGAVTAFMQAVADSNLDRLAQLWGTAKGPAARTNSPPDYQRRLVIILGYLRGASAKVLGKQSVQDRKDRTALVVELTRGDCVKSVPFVTVKTPKDGWIVNAIDLRAVGAPGRSCTEEAPADSSAAPKQ